MENTYRDVNIAIANEFSRLAERFGVNVWEAISLANRHPRVKVLSPGPGVGGHAAKLANQVINLFNDHHYTPEMAERTAQVVLGSL